MDQTSWGETSWRPEAELQEHLDAAVPDILAGQKDNGQFGTEPWISTDQNVLLPLAAVYVLPESRHQGDDQVLDAIARGGLALAEAADGEGCWEFRKKDGSEWGPIRMPWTYSRWVRAYKHVGHLLPADARGRWEAGLRLGYEGIAAHDMGRIHNIPAHHAMGLYCAGQVFERPDWCDQAAEFLHRVAAAQSPHGWWAEHDGPVVAYNFVYAEALGVYLSLSADKAVLPALERAARYHAEFTYPDGSAVETVDGRNPYHAGVCLGNCGFAKTAAGRGWLAHQHHLHLAQGSRFAADYAAAMLLYGGEGPIEPPASQRERHAYRMGDKALTVRRAPWFACLSAITTEIPQNRWGQDRQNFVSLFHDRLGVVLGGGDTKLQPLWSSFTVGDPALLAHTPGEEVPDFSPRPGLLHVPDAVEVGASDDEPTLHLRYGGTSCRIALRFVDEETAQIELSATGEGPVAAHLTLMPWLGEPLAHSDGGEALLGEDEVVWETAAGSDEAGWLRHGGWRLTLPAGSRVTWPVLPHNPYRKDGSATIEEARVVVSLSLPDPEPRYLTLQRV